MRALSGLLLAIFLTAPGLGASPQWSATLGLGGMVSPGTWAPLRLETPAQAGEWTLEVVLVSASGRETSRVTTQHLTGGRHEEPLFLSDSTRKLHLKFSTQGVLREELTLSLEGRSFPGHLIGVAGVGPSVRSALAEVLLPREPVRVVQAPPDQWPTSPLAWGNFAALVVQDPGAVLSPAQRKSLRAWISSGGRLLVVEPRPEGLSLLAQVGAVPGWGKASAAQLSSDPEFWQRTLELQPYGRLPRLGTEFEPSAVGLPPVGQPNSPAAVIFILVWAALGSLVLLVRRRGTAGWPLTWAVLGSAAVLVLSGGGFLTWDRGLSVHGREMVLPGDEGRFTSLEVSLPASVINSVGWSQASPWALDLWKAGAHQPGFVRTETPRRVVREAFLPAVARPSDLRVSWAGGLRWWQKTGETWTPREEAPAEFGPDLGWVTRWAAASPQTTWAVGRLESTTWLRPEVSGGPP